MKRLWHQCHTALSRATKVVVLSLVVLASVFSGVVPAQAQTAINYAEYVNLFKGTNPPASLTPYSLFKTENGTTTPDVKFNLQMSFAGISRDNAGDDKEAAWAKIRDFNDSAYVFLLRICDVNDPTETRCLFARIPHKRVPLSPPPTNQQTPEIYHYQYTNVFSSDLQNDKFNVLFPVTALIGVNPQGLIVQNPVSDFVFIGNTTTYKADAWYCAQGNNIPTQNDPSNPNYRMFNDICGNGKPYFKIATSATFRMPQSAAEAQSQVPGTITPVDTTPTQSNVPSCGFIDWSILGCIAQVAYYLIYRPIAWFAGLMGNLFDFFLGYSLSDASYRAEFAVRGWQIVRDICNIFFVIILVWVGLMTVFKTSSYNPKKVLATLVINALLINFSLFVTRVVIDVSNITARVFYHSVEVCDGPCQKDAQGVIQNTKPGIGGYTPLSEKIVSAFNPQKIFSMNVLSASSMLPDNGTTAQGGAKTLSVGDSEYAGYYLVVSLIAALILFAIAMMFWKTAFFFLGRVIGLYMAMIFSPFAFLARDGVPIVGSIKKLSWNSWLGDLTKYATLAPIFVFFLYVIYSFLETDFLKVYQEKIGTNFFETVVYIAIPMLIVYFMINQGVKIAEEYAGDFGKGVQNAFQKATGFVGGAALGVATGGVALAGRNVLGRVGTKIADSQGLRDAMSKGGIRGWLAEKTLKMGGGMSTATYDARNTTAAKKFQAQAGVNLDNKLVRMTGTGTDKTQGGYKEAVNRNEKVLNERAERFQLRGQAAIDQDAKNKAWESAYQGRRGGAERAALAAGNAFDEVAFRAQDLAQQASAGNARAESSAEINRKREKQYQQTLTRGTILSRVAKRVTNRVTAPTGTAGAATAAVNLAVGTTAATVGGAAVAAGAAIIGQGAIQGAARAAVIHSRDAKSKDTISASERSKLEQKLKQLGVDRLRLQTTLGPVVRNAGVASIDDLTVLDVQNYIAAQLARNPNFTFPSPNTIISERNRVNADIDATRTKLGYK